MEYKEYASKGVAVEIYPREGTETNIKEDVQKHRKLKFIPVRGRKHIERADQPTCILLKFISVRGRKRVT